MSRELGEINMLGNEINDSIRKYRHTLYFISWIDDASGRSGVTKFEYGIIHKDKELFNILKNVIRGDISYILLSNEGIYVQWSRDAINPYGRVVGTTSSYDSLYSIILELKEKGMSDEERIILRNALLMLYDRIENMTIDKDTILSKIDKLEEMIKEYISSNKNTPKYPVTLIKGKYERHIYTVDDETYTIAVEGIEIRDEEFAETILRLNNLDMELDENYPEIIKIVLTDNDILVNIEEPIHHSACRYYVTSIFNIIKSVRWVVENKLPNKDKLLSYMKKCLELI
ncbi:MAG: hypothetical protein QW669_03755 [Desulfurococcaceae archaeon]